MVPCPWAREASSRYRGEDIGVHLTVNAEYEFYRWGPITFAPSLLGGDGGFPRTLEDVWTTPTSTRFAASAEPRLSGRSCGASTSAISMPHGCASTPTRVLRRLPGAGAGIRPPVAYGQRLHGALRRVPGPCRCRRQGCRLHRSLPSGARRGLARSSADIATLRPGGTEVISPAVDSAELRSLATDDWAAASTTVASSATRAGSGDPSTRPERS